MICDPKNRLTLVFDAYSHVVSASAVSPLDAYLTALYRYPLCAGLPVLW